MNKIRISAVKYANTYPFIYGLQKSGFERKADIVTDHPSDCAEKLIDGRADIGLVPVAALPAIKNSTIISNYCLGADGKVRTVMLLSHCRFEDIEAINLDYRSRSSVNLSKVLAKKSWNREFIWKSTSDKSDFINIGKNEAVVLIGDQCFEYENRFRYRIDLAEEWKKLTGLPFVFACWASNRTIDRTFLEDFNRALSSGVNNIDAVVERFGSTGTIRGSELKRYLTENISFDLNDQKKEAIDLFLEMLRSIE
jgi:chorismate dehydratase